MPESSIDIEQLLGSYIQERDLIADRTVQQGRMQADQVIAALRRARLRPEGHLDLEQLLREYVQDREGTAATAAGAAKMDFVRQEVLKTIAPQASHTDARSKRPKRSLRAFIRALRERTSAGGFAPGFYDTSGREVLLHSIQMSRQFLSFRRANENALQKCIPFAWPALYVYLRLQGYEAAPAQDLLWRFLFDAVGRRLLDTPKAQRKPVRLILLDALNDFLATADGEPQGRPQGLGSKPEPDRVSAIAAYEYRWAMTMMGFVFMQLKSQIVNSTLDFEELKHFVVTNVREADYVSLAARMKVTPVKVRVTLARMRARFAVLLREEVARTIPDDEGVEGEVRYLLAALRREVDESENHRLIRELIPSC